jgi:hypothetical protein
MGSTTRGAQLSVHHTMLARAGGALAAMASALVVTIATVAVGLLVAAAPAGASGPSIAGAGAALPANAPPGSAATLISTSCPAAGNCVAVGSYGVGSPGFGLIETLSGGSWQATEAPVVTGAVAEELVAVSCPSVGNCVATGAYRDAAMNQFGLVVTESGGTWTAAPAPVPSGAAADPGLGLLSVSCPAPGSCAAVGLYQDASAQEVGALLTLSGGTWTAIRAPLPGNASVADEVLDVSCGAAGSCEAVGIYAGSPQNGLLLSLSGGTWTATEAPLPADAAVPNAAFMVSVSCPAAGTCAAAGTYQNAAGNSVPLIESISGGVVTPFEGPLPANASSSAGSGGSLLGIACPSTSSCEAVGGYDSTAGSGSAPLIETLSGGSWSATEAPGSFDPSDTTILFGVSCSWPGSCSAFGISSASSTSSTGVIETLSDGTWSESSMVMPSDGTNPPQVKPGLEISQFVIGSPISCSGGTCVFAGAYKTMADLEMGLLNWSPNLTGYQLVASDGGLFAFNAPFYGSMGGQHLNAPIVGMAVVPDSGGYYEVASDGGIFAFNAPFYGSMGGQHLNKPIVGIAFDTLTGGYYEVASDGGIFAFNAPFYGSMGGQHLNKPIVAIAFDPATGGYYEVASDGGIFAFHAPFEGSTGGLVLNKPVVGMAVDVATGGYYEVASDGGIFAWGAPFQGSTGSLVLDKPVVGMAYDYVTGGYYLAASDGGIFAFNAPFQQSLGGQHLNAPVVGLGFG